MNLNKGLASLITVAVSVTCIAAGSAATDQKTETRIRELLSKMTLEEKIGQMNQLTGIGATEGRMGEIASGQVGSILNEVDPAVVNKLQKQAIKKSRLGIPLVFARDVIHGYKTIYPIPLGQAATWDDELVELGARYTAEEASSDGIRWTFSPMIDVSRDARWGRIAESFGEDPLLNGRLGAAMIRGYQSDDLSRPNTMAACTKHFACYGAAEGGVDYNTTILSPELLANVYLPPFKKAVDAGSATFMCSFNDINGIPSSGNRALLRDTLRNAWGYDGVMCSDWSSIDQMIPHGYARDLRHAALLAVNAGVDVDMESHAYPNHLKELVETGEVSMAEIDEMVANILRLKFRLGLFDNPYVNMKKASVYYTPEALAAARKAVEESAILLTNNGILPIKDNGIKVAVIGSMADDPHNQAGTWVFDFEKEKCLTPLTSLKEIYGENLTFVPAYDYSRATSKEEIPAAVEAARNADVVLAFLGEESILSGEGRCRADITLPGIQKELLRELKKTCKPIVAVIQAGRQLALTEEKELADAILYVFHGGTMAGPAIADLLTGKVNPSGHTPVSFPTMSGQEPLYYNHKSTGRPAAEDVILIDRIPVREPQFSTGVSSYLMDAGPKPLFPFGYGLSYTTFEYSDPVVSSTSIDRNGKLTVSCTVTNTGDREGSDVAQLYVRDLVGSLVRPVAELKDYRRLSLKPGESKTVTFTLTPDDLACLNANGEFRAEPGDFTVRIAPDSEQGKSVTFTLKD